MVERQIRFVVWLVAVVMLACGCGGPGYEGPQRSELKGKVTFDGNPVKQGALTLIPAGSEGNKVSVPITDGAYLIPEARGPNAGKYRVEIYGFEPLNTAPAGGSQDADAESATRQVIPPQFNAQTTLELNVDAPKMEKDFELSSR
jgi:hypothetical protein